MKKDQRKKQYLFVCHGKDCIKRDSKEVQRALEKELKSIGRETELRNSKNPMYGPL